MIPSRNKTISARLALFLALAALAFGAAFFDLLKPTRVRRPAVALFFWPLLAVPRLI